MFTLLTVIDKNEGWKVATVRDVEGVTTENVSISKADKKGDLQWVAFDTFKVGAAFEATLWKSEAGKAYLFPSKVRATGTTARSGGASGAVKAAEITRESVEKTTENKELNIRVSATMRAATDITLASIKDVPFPTTAEFEKEWDKWRDWYLGKWKQTKGIADQAF